MKTKSHTLSYTSFIGSIHRVVSLVKLLGQGIGLLGYWLRVLWYWMRMGWYWMSLLWIYSVRAFFVFVFAVLLWDFTDLLGIPLIQDLKAQIHEAVSLPAKLFVKEDPARIRERALVQARRIEIEVIQAHCRHITRRNGLWNYFCPLCGKKLIEIGDPPLWQI